MPPSPIAQTHPGAHLLPGKTIDGAVVVTGAQYETDAHSLKRLSNLEVPSKQLSKMQEPQTRPFASLWPEDKHERDSSVATRSFASLRIDSPIFPASHKVLTTYELLEPILLQLTCQQIMIVQRVARSWRAVVQRSRPLQERVFHVASEKSVQPTTWLASSAVHRIDWGVHRIVYDKLSLEMCPAAPIEQRNNSSAIVASWSARDFGGVLQLSIGLGGAIEPAPPDRTASWWDMHVSSPPLPAISLDFLPDVPEQGYAMTLYNPAGVRLGDLFEWTWKLGSLFERTTGHTLDGRLVVASFWLTDSGARAEFEEAW